MLNIFLKDLRQNLYLLIVCFLLPFTAPPISKIFFKSEWVDAKAILYIILFFFFIPIYMVIMSFSIFRNENLNIFKILPVSYNKIILSKISFLLFNYFLLSTYYFSFVDFFRFQTEKIEMFMIYFLHLIIVLFLCFLSFSFSNFLRKDLALFLVFFITLFNVFIFSFVIAKTMGHMLLAFEIYFLYLFIFLFSIFLSYLSSKYKLLNKDFTPLIKILFILIFLIPSFYLLTQTEKWKKWEILTNSSIVPINEEEILLEKYFKSNEEIYLYNLKNNNLKVAADFIGLNIRNYDENKIYLTSNIKISFFCKEAMFCTLFYSFDTKTKQIKKIGNFPLRTHFYGNFILFSGWNEKVENRYLIGFKKQGEENCFTDRARDYVFLKEGVFYKKIEENKNRFYYATYDNFEKKLVLEGKWDFYILWSFYLLKFRTPISHWYLSRDGEYFMIKMPNGKIKSLGKLVPLLSFDEDHFLAYEKAENKTILYLFKNEEISKKIELPFLEVWSNYSAGKYHSINYRDKKGYGTIIASLEKEELKFYYLPKNTIKHYLLKKDGELITLKEKRIPFFKDAKYHKAYLYNFKTGKERPL